MRDNPYTDSFYLSYCCSVTKSCPTLHDPMDCSTPGFPVPHHLLQFPKFMSVDSVMLSSYLMLCHSLLLLPSVFPGMRSFPVSQSAVHIRWPKCCSCSLSPSSVSEYSGLISSRIDWFDLLAVQGTLKSVL